MVWEMLIITGPTAVGKSAFAIEHAAQCDGEIINADSQQVYIGCDIGTGKIPRAERRVPHHLLDLVTPDQQFNVAQFVRHADAAIADIRARGHRPIVVGGTGLYVRALMFGLADTPPGDAVVRAALESQLAAHGVDALHAELAHRDPTLAATIHPHHTTRLIRALEVWQLTGQSPLALHRAHKKTPRYDAQWIGLTLPRDILRTRITERVQTQLDAGWLEEVRRIVTQYGVAAPALRAIGYRELANYLQQGGEWNDVVRDITTATHHYAKRQMTYLQKIAEIEWR